MICATCHGETPDGKPFCANCGAALVARCAHCGSELVVGKPFCAECGTPVAQGPVGRLVPPPATSTPPSPTSPTADPALLAERRLCSVLIVDTTE